MVKCSETFQENMRYVFLNMIPDITYILTDECIARINIERQKLGYNAIVKKTYLIKKVGNFLYINNSKINFDFSQETADTFSFAFSLAAVALAFTLFAFALALALADGEIETDESTVQIPQIQHSLHSSDVTLQNMTITSLMELEGNIEDEYERRATKSK